MPSRREFFERGGKAAASLCLFGSGKSLLAAADPHYFLHVLLKDGVDATYLFDARSALFTEKGKVSNYRQDKSVHLWEDGRGGKTWVSSFAQTLAGRRSEFSILNGVHMARGFDGHPQNTAMAITGSATGGRLFATDFPRPSDVPLGFLAQGRFDGIETPSLESGISLRAPVARRLAERFRGAAAPDPSLAPMRFVMDRAAALASASNGAFAHGAGLYEQGLANSGQVIDKQKTIKLCGDDSAPPCEDRYRIAETETSALLDGLKTASEYFQRGLTRNALLSVNYDVDTHDVSQAREQESVYTKIAADLNDLFDFLACPIDSSGATLGGRTTVLITSEFSRSLRQIPKPIDATGTDHNPFTNTVLLAGKGIRTGLIVGATDLDELDDQGEFKPVSAAHLSLDPNLLQPMGRPFDHASLSVLPSLPGVYDGTYLTFLNVVNTLYRLVGAPDDVHKKFGRSGPAAKVLTGLLR